MKRKTKFIIAALLLLCSLLFIVLLKCVDVKAIGPENTEVGLSSVNNYVHAKLGVHESWYKLTEIFGVLALCVCGIFACLGIYQLAKRKSLKEVDFKIYALGGLYVIVLSLYVLFEKIVINYRPVIMEGEEHAEASFPSSHTMLICTVLGSAMLVAGDYIKNRSLLLCLNLIMVILIILTVFGRLFSGVHWFSDIIGGVLISATLLMFFDAAIDEKK